MFKFEIQRNELQFPNILSIIQKPKLEVGSNFNTWRIFSTLNYKIHIWSVCIILGMKLKKSEIF